MWKFTAASLSDASGKGEGGSPKPANCSLVPSDASDRVLAVAILEDDHGQVVVAHGNALRPSFHALGVAASKSALRSEVVVPAAESSDMLLLQPSSGGGGAAKQSANGGNAHEVHVAAAAQSKRADPKDLSTAGASPRSGSRKRAGRPDADEEDGDGEEDGQAAKSRKRSNSDGTGAGQTLGERVAALAADLDVDMDSEDDEDDRLLQEERARAVIADQYGGQHVPKAKSMTAVIEQALHVDDDALLEHCLSTRDVRIIEASVARLPVTRVLPLLKRLVGKLEARPSRGPDLIAWIRCIFEQHTAYLMGAPGERTRLSTRLSKAKSPAAPAAASACFLSSVQPLHPALLTRLATTFDVPPSLCQASRT